MKHKPYAVWSDEWLLSQARDFSEKVWAFVKEKGFFGLVIPKEYGGKGFSAEPIRKW